MHYKSICKPLIMHCNAPYNALVTHILRNIFFCVQQKKEIHTEFEQLEDLNNFWVNYPFVMC